LAEAGFVFIYREVFTDELQEKFAGYIPINHPPEIGTGNAMFLGKNILKENNPGLWIVMMDIFNVSIQPGVRITEIYKDEIREVLAKFCQSDLAVVGNINPGRFHN
jgi:hypothetical protein